MGQALYRKYRSKSFSEVIGQEPITQTLEKAINSGHISHAYLLAGPRGVGKTSVARILAHEVNKLPYKDEAIHMDIIEIDAASNRRIDEIRDIRQKVHIAPTSADYKVYIIDEVHMLTKEAFNALLKTLEEPPAHVIFILATTEPHKLPETITSRTQRFNFKPIDSAKAVAHLKKIAKLEKIDVDPSALELIAKHSGGSFRDAISMLDQLSGTNQAITEEDVQELLGLPPPDSVSKLVELVSRGAAGDILGILHEMREAGNSPALIAAGLSSRLRSQIVATGFNQYGWSTNLLKNLLDVGSSGAPYELLEISLLEATMANSAPVSAPAPEPTSEVVTRPSKPVAKKNHKQQVSEASSQPITPGQVFSMDLWPEVLDEIKNRAASIYTALRLAEPEIEGNVITLTFQFPLHKKKVEQSRHIKLVGDVVQGLSGARLEIKCVLSEKPTTEAKLHQPEPAIRSKLRPSELATISNIFGSAEVLE